jgi:RimJ/RimL family protein N-acetyltransferase
LARGYATKIGAEVVEHAFSALGLAALVGFTRSDNLASRRVLDRSALTSSEPFVAHGEESGAYRRATAGGPAASTA